MTVFDEYSSLCDINVLYDILPNRAKLIDAKHIIDAILREKTQIVFFVISCCFGAILQISHNILLNRSLTELNEQTPITHNKFDLSEKLPSGCH